VIDFFEIRKWLQKGSFSQQDSKLCHDPLIPHQLNSAREALIFKCLEKWWCEKTCCGICSNGPGLGMIRRSDGLFDHTGRSKGTKSTSPASEEVGLGNESESIGWRV
jgi:hypothetical protein